MEAFRETCHAKLNLYLAVTGRRADGYHDLVSLVAQVAVADELSADVSSTGADILSCDDASLAGADNLVLKAAAAYRKRVPEAPFMAWELTKRLPYGAGMGGGSSDAAGALRLLNRFCGKPLDAETLADVAAEVGSDCPLFLQSGPCLMRGRGEKLTPLPETAAKVLRNQSVAIVKPHFGIPTGWAYRAIDDTQNFTSEAVAEAELAAWLKAPATPLPVRNSFMDVAYGKYLAYGAFNDALHAAGLPEVILTGSGSAAFAIAGADATTAIATLAPRFFGPGSYACSTKFA